MNAEQHVAMVCRQCGALLVLMESQWKCEYCGTEYPLDLKTVRDRRKTIVKLVRCGVVTPNEARVFFAGNDAPLIKAHDVSLPLPKAHEVSLPLPHEHRLNPLLLESNNKESEEEAHGKDTKTGY